MIERGKRLARVLDIRIGHRGVLAHDVHRADGAPLGRVQDLDDRETRIGIECHAPQLLETLTHVG